MARHQQQFKRQSISIWQAGERLVYQFNWYNRKGVRTTASTGTRDETEAKIIGIGMEQLVNDPTTYDADPLDPRFEKIHPRALQVFFGLKALPARPKSVIVVSKNAFKRTDRATAWGPEENPWTIVPNEEATNQKENRIGLERKLAQIEKEKNGWEQERLDYQRRLNDHCKITMAGAIEAFDAHYKAGHDAHTFKQVMRVNRELADIVGSDERVGEIRGADINAYIDDYGDGEIEQNTRRKVRAYISTFWSWAVRHYELNANPMLHVHPISTNSPEHIEAIREHADLTAYLDALKPWPFWRTWIAFACLVGPRWNEQAHVKLSDVHSDVGYVRIFSRKTGKERNVPIERNVLRPILAEFISQTRVNILPEKKDWPWLFPSWFAGHGAKGDGRWRSSTWHKHWSGGENPDGKVIVGIANEAKKKSEAYYWKYGPDEWRHCGATAMGHSGLSSLQISQWIGNSETMCRRHYIAPVGARSWPLKWSD